MRKLRHPEAKRAAIEARVDERNAAVRERCIIPGFGYLILLYRADGSRHTRDAETYPAAVAIRNTEMAGDSGFEKAWIIQKRWDARMSITSDPRDRENAHDRWIRSAEDDDL